MFRAAIISLAVFGAPLPASADWGGVAVNSDGIGWGYSAGWNSRSKASARAMHYCHEFSDNDAGCKVVITTTSCAAIVRGRVKSSPKLFVEGAKDRNAAEAAAMAQCREAAGASCELRRKFCASDL